MPLRLGIVTCAHMHVLSYVYCLKGNPEAAVVGIWDHDAERGRKFAADQGLPFFETYEALLDACDGVCIGSENVYHAKYGIQAANAGKHIICEKPLVTVESEGEEFLSAARANKVRFMTAFPCRFSPAFISLKNRVKAGEIGEVRAICATNRGRCPYGWFIDPALSGGGAMIDHVVHVTDLLRDLVGAEPTRVQAQIGNNVYGETWEDTAMLTIEFPGVFATLDSSWSRPGVYKTWGDVTMNVVGDKGVIELDMFGSGLGHYHKGHATYTLAAHGANLDALMVEEFLAAIREERDPIVTGFDGFQAARVAIAGYRSVQSGQPVTLS